MAKKLTGAGQPAGHNSCNQSDNMERVKFFGLLEHIGFYLIFLSLLAFLFSDSLIFIYLAIISWLVSFISHIIESKSENQTAKKILTGV